MIYSKKIFIKIFPILTTSLLFALPVSCKSLSIDKVETQHEVKPTYTTKNIIDNYLLKQINSYDENEIIKSLIIKKYHYNNLINPDQLLIEFNYEKLNNLSSINFSEWKNNIDKTFIFNKKTKIKSISHFYDESFVYELKTYLVSNYLINENSNVSINLDNEIYFDINDYCFKVNFICSEMENLESNINLQINIPIENVEFNFNVSDLVIFNMLDQKVIFESKETINLKGFVPLDSTRIDNLIFERKIFLQEINDFNILNELGFVDKKTNNITSDNVKNILKLNSVTVRNIWLKRQSYYEYQLNISLISNDKIYWNDLTCGEKTISINNIFVSNNFSSYINKIESYQNKNIPTILIDNFTNYEINFNHLKLFLLDLTLDHINNMFYPKIKDYLILQNAYVYKIVDLKEIKDNQNKLICYEMKLIIKSNYDSIFFIDNKIDFVEINCYLNFAGRSTI